MESSPEVGYACQGHPAAEASEGKVFYFNQVERAIAEPRNYELAFGDCRCLLLTAFATDGQRER